MNVIISNRNKQILDNLNIEIIKRLDGEYSVEELKEVFQNFFFNKMIIDITALKNFEDYKTMQQLSMAFDMNKVLLLLDPNSRTTTPEFLSRIISMGIYNFTTNIEGLVYLYNNPNGYKDVAQYHSVDSMIVEEQQPIQQEQPQIFQSQIIEPEPLTPEPIQPEPVKPTLITPIENQESAYINEEPKVEANQEESAQVEYKPTGKKRIIGIKSITPGAGATTLTYLMKKQLERKYNVLAIEVEKRDFIYFNDKTLLSLSNGIIGETLNTNNDKDVILVDLNASPTAENFCTEILNLIEPSIIKINRLLSIKPKILSELKNKTIILCPSSISDKDVKSFEYEANLKVFYNLKPVDDHTKNEEIRKLLNKLGFDKLK